EREELARLPPPQLQALEVALLRAAPGAAPPEAHGVAVALLNALRVLAQAAPLVVAIDDLQWIDDPSCDALAFAARRLESEPVAWLLARRPGAPSALERALEPASPERIEVGPPSFGAARRVLAEGLGLILPPNV